jgi:hypothetical protein
MATSGSRFELPGKVENYLGILSKVYKRERKDVNDLALRMRIS